MNIDAPFSSDTTSTSLISILIVDDEQDFAQGLARLLRGHFPHIDVITANNGEDALTILSARKIQLMMSDLRMPRMSGLELLHKALAIQPNVSMLMLTAHGSIETAVEALQAGAYDFLTKPIEAPELFRIIEKGLERSHLIDENRRLRSLLAKQEKTNELVGESHAMQQLKSAINAIAQCDYTVLIRGESGTGKELVAQYIQKLGSRANEPYLTVNCPAIPEKLLESELFGHVKGAFTGADKDHKGMFSEADGGTILLDEIGDISASVQTKLLRCLQNGEIRPVGSNRSHRINVRVIASTNQNLEAHIQDKSFREDLYYRLNVLTVTLPPLRKRLDDIPLLVRNFLQQYCAELGVQEKTMDTALLQWLMEQPWPGNIRELQNFIRRLIIFSQGTHIGLEVIQYIEKNTLNTPFLSCPVPSACASFKTENKETMADFFEQNAGANDGSGSLQYTEPLQERLLANYFVSNTTQTPLQIIYPDGTAVPYKDAKGQVVDEFTRVYAQTLLKRCHGNISEVARMSGLSRVALTSILQRLDIKSANFRSM